MILLTAEQMRKADQLTIAAGTSEMELIRNAGLCVAEEVMKIFEPNQGKIVLCSGGGNNGADGYIAAYHLAAAGYEVHILPLVPIDKLDNERAAAANQALRLIPNPQDDFQILEEATLILDALFGTGLNRAPTGKACELIAKMNESSAKRISIDIPSGIGANQAAPLGEEAVHAFMTVTFFRPKLAHYLYPAANYCGKIICRQIGIKEEVLNHIGRVFFLNKAPVLPSPLATSHKYSRGHSLIVAGEAFHGAGALCTMAAQRAGSGLVSLLCSEHNIPIMRACVPASCIVRPLDDLNGIAKKRKLAAALIGPGSGNSEQTAKQVVQLAAQPIALVLDADAISSFASYPHLLFDALATRSQTVLTPHMGEFALIFPAIEGTNKLEKALAAARQANAVMVLKGADTVIASPKGNAVINADASPYLATGGSGDVLAGIIVALLAQGMDDFTAACAAVFIHSQCAKQKGPNLIPEDLISALAQVCGQFQN